MSPRRRRDDARSAFSAAKSAAVATLPDRRHPPLVQHRITDRQSIKSGADLAALVTDEGTDQEPPSADPCSSHANVRRERKGNVGCVADLLLPCKVVQETESPARCTRMRQG